MKLTLSLILFIALVPAVVANAAGEETSEAVLAAETLQSKLLEVQAKEAELQARAKQLEEDVKPENIERSLAGIGSTRPEDLRELRRRQLSIELDSVRAQLKLVTTSRERLETAIRGAEARAYQQSAEGTPPLSQVLAAQSAVSSTWRIAMLVGLIAVLALLVVGRIARRSYLSK